VERIAGVQELEDRLSEPTEKVVRTLGVIEGDIIVLGAGGKMGPSLSRMAKRGSEKAGVKRRIIAVSRFTNSAVVGELNGHGVETISCDILDEDQVSRLPDAPNVVYMAGMKFGTTGNESMTWALNAFLPGIACRRYRGSRIVAFSSGNVYGLVPVSSGGSKETDEPNPVGEYAWSVLGRERIFQHFSVEYRIPVVLLRLNYACELRYGVLVDIAQKVHNGKPVDLSMGWLNTIWQRDANAMALQSFAQAVVPARILNITGPETLRVRDAAKQLGKIMGKRVTFQGVESESALLNDSSTAHALFGKPAMKSDALLEVVADWVARGGESLGKPTHFESRDGRF
jgi:nucleoside-diphosphate-sugar epimerase